MIIQNLNTNANLAKKIVTDFAKYISKKRPISLAHSALKDALITPKDKVPKQTKNKIKIFTDKYWSDWIHYLSTYKFRVLAFFLIVPKIKIAINNAEKNIFISKEYEYSSEFKITPLTIPIGR